MGRKESGAADLDRLANTERLVSVVIPVFNAGKFIDETIGTVRSQTYDCWELILVDDGSSDDGIEKIEKWCREDERIRLIVKEKTKAYSGEEYRRRPCEGKVYCVSRRG